MIKAAADPGSRWRHQDHRHFIAAATCPSLISRDLEQVDGIETVVTEPRFYAFLSQRECLAKFLFNQNTHPHHQSDGCWVENRLGQRIALVFDQFIENFPVVYR